MPNYTKSQTTGRFIPITEKRICVACDTEASYKLKNGIELWHTHDGHRMCHYCYMRHVRHPAFGWIHAGRRINPHGKKRIILQENPRKGECSRCNKKIGDTYINYYGQVAIMKRTHIHHIQYDENDVLKDTIELCASCHMKESRRLKKISRSLLLL